MSDFLTCWYFNNDIVHNAVLAALYSWILFQLCVLTYKIITNKIQEKKSYYFRRLFFFLLFYFILGELVFLLLRKKFFYSWVPSGWFMQDIVLYIIYSVMFVSISLFLIKHVKQMKAKEKKIKDSIWAVIIILLTEFLIGSFFLVVFNGALSTVKIELESPIVIVEEGNNTLAITKMRMVLPNGVEHGITTNTVKFTLVAVDLEEGSKCWTRLSGWQEYIIGESAYGILTINNKKEELYFIDPLTGKTSLTEKEWVQKFPVLKDNLSYSEYDYYLVSENELYLYALDGKYYKADLVSNTITESPDYKDIVSEKFFGSSNSSELSDEELQWITKSCTTYYSDLLNVRILWAEDRNSALISYQKKRNEENLTISMVSLKEDLIKWTTEIDYNETGTLADSISVSAKNGSFYVISDGNLYKLRQDSGKVEYIYQYRWNKVK
ncbi:MAG TPA: PA2928 family protein [Lachnospiraceae bacterium]|nr:PA2928 family protein [Lachnospiraceae bacterium]